ncbi:MAG TPA: DUF1501 domain-containing protein [Cyclobacteriaceae bacterium]|nr:DUF1501 domain-containing protein [Cyclobacteriaceae bacterium]
MQRREFLVGCSAAIAAMAGSRITGFSFAQEGGGNKDIFVYIFLRGGCDGLNLVGPVNDPFYVAERPLELRVSDSGNNAGLSLTNGLDGLDFRLHPKAAELKELYDCNALAIIHGAGLTNGTRSHFDAQDFIERGSLNDKNLSEGWFTRFLKSESQSPDSMFQSMAISSITPSSFLGSNNTVALTSLGDYKLRGDARLPDLLRSFYKGNQLIDEVANKTLDSIQYLGKRLATNPSEVVDAAHLKNAGYPENNPFGRSLANLAQVIKMDIGIQIATVDYGGWDTHEHQTNIFNNLTEGLSKSLGAFYNDISNYHRNVTILVMSEFGRRLKANKSGGTDHGHGNVMLALGGNVKGGKMYGKWPGLSNEQLDNNVDLAVTTDYRTVLSEVVVRRLKNPKLGYIFPNLKEYKPLNFLQGADLPVDFASR